MVCTNLHCKFNHLKGTLRTLSSPNTAASQTARPRPNLTPRTQVSSYNEPKNGLEKIEALIESLRKDYQTDMASIRSEMAHYRYQPSIYHARPWGQFPPQPHQTQDQYRFPQALAAAGQPMPYANLAAQPQATGILPSRPLISQTEMGSHARNGNGVPRSSY